ncbi:hypothetical protein KCM76_22255 [Zooshikella marina]|uniref:hypothetical protein n=1 Tax=Zooshikella ganghwensis TaxID=202772 RepID=UPI001BB05D23|nr:hypothetical protein [Zooshikella ganghwensis]MBU2708732.1 hypothetical protein [Zooshikella ganghwensis]
MPDQKQPGKLKKTGSFVWRYLLPFRSMGQTVGLVKNEITRSKDNLGTIKELGGEAARRVVEVTSKKNVKNQSFEDAINNRPEGSLNIPELIDHFLTKKRITLMFFGVLALVSAVGIFTGIAYGQIGRIFFASLTCITALPVLFLYALQTQLRVWQLRNRRLSKEEKGGIKDFMRETKNWFWATLNPELPLLKSRG